MIYFFLNKANNKTKIQKNMKINQIGILLFWPRCIQGGMGGGWVKLILFLFYHSLMKIWTYVALTYSELPEKPPASLFDVKLGWF